MAEGLSHSDQLIVRETWHLARDPARGRLLVNDLVLDDAASFTKPISLRRVFAWSPDAQFDRGALL